MPCRRFGGCRDCPEDGPELSPASDEGQRVAEVFPLMMGQIRVSMAGPYGIDLPAALAVAEAAGVERAVAAELISGIEAGMVGHFRAVQAALEKGRGDDKPDL